MSDAELAVKITRQASSSPDVLVLEAVLEVDPSVRMRSTVLLSGLADVDTELRSHLTWLADQVRQVHVNRVAAAAVLEELHL